MNRRNFLRSAGAAAVIPALPLSALVTPVAAAPANAMQVGWAALYARANNQASPALIQKWLRVGPDQAQALMSELTKRQIIHAPIAGSAAAVQPMYPNGTVPGVFQKSKQVAQKAREVFDTLLEEDVPAERADPVDPESTPTIADQNSEDTRHEAS